MSLRISDNASLIHFTFTRSPFHWGQNVGRQNCAYLELLSSLNVVLYICETLSVKKMKRCQNGNLVLHVMECGLSKETLFKSLLLEPIRIQDLRQLRVILIWSDTNASLAHTWSGYQSDSLPQLFHFSCRVFE